MKRQQNLIKIQNSRNFKIKQHFSQKKGNPANLQEIWKCPKILEKSLFQKMRRKCSNFCWKHKKLQFSIKSFMKKLETQNPATFTKKHKFVWKSANFVENVKKRWISRKFNFWQKKVILQANICRMWIKSGWKGRSVSVVFDRFEVISRRVPNSFFFSIFFRTRKFRWIFNKNWNCGSRNCTFIGEYIIENLSDWNEK